MDAESKAEIHRRLGDDPWIPTEQLLTTSVEPWKILVGAERLPAAQTVQVSKENPLRQPCPSPLGFDVMPPHGHSAWPDQSAEKVRRV